MKPFIIAPPPARPSKGIIASMGFSHILDPDRTICGSITVSRNGAVNIIASDANSGTSERGLSDCVDREQLAAKQKDHDDDHDEQAEATAVVMERRAKIETAATEKEDQDN